MGELTEVEHQALNHLVLAVDTSEIDEAHQLMSDFADAGGTIVKLGLEAQANFGGPEGLSRLAQEHDLSWVYDGKIKDIGNTMKQAISSIVTYQTVLVTNTFISIIERRLPYCGYNFVHYDPKHHHK